MIISGEPAATQYCPGAGYLLYPFTRSFAGVFRRRADDQWTILALVAANKGCDIWIGTKMFARTSVNKRLSNDVTSGLSVTDS